MVKALLDRNDVNPNTVNQLGQTPLCTAACTGDEGVVKMLLDRNDVNPNTVNQHGQTPLFIAARDGHERVVKTLLERVDVKSDMADLASQTALSQALKGGHEAIVKLLSEHRNSIPSSSGDGFTALSSPELTDSNQRPPKESAGFDLQPRGSAPLPPPRIFISSPAC